MKKITFEIEMVDGNIYEIQSYLMSRSLFFYLAGQKITTAETDQKILLEIVNAVEAQWRINGMEWTKENWNELPPAIISAWLEKLIAISGQKVEAKVKSEKK